MCAAAGLLRWFPGAACWRETFGIHWWDAMSLLVVSWRRLRPLWGGGLVYFLLAWLSSAATIFGPTVAVPGRADDSCKRSARVDLCAFFLACDSVCPVPFAGLAAHGVGGSGRMDSLVYGFHRSA